MAWVETFAALTTSLAAASDIANRVADNAASKKVDVALAPLKRQLRDVEQHALALSQVHLATKERCHALLEENGELREAKRQLEVEKKQLRAWQENRDQYQRRDLGEDAFVYKRKSGQASADKPHEGAKYCVPCLDQGEPSTLQRAGYDGSLRVLKCPSCENEVRYRDPRDEHTGPTVVRVRNRWDDLF